MSSFKYRSLPYFLADNEQFISLSLRTKGILMVLALKLPYFGIGTVMPEALKVYAQCSLDEVEEALGELVDEGWIDRFGNVVFLRDALDWQPNYSSKNDNHIPNLQAGLSILPERAVEAFLERYPEWHRAVGERSRLPRAGRFDPLRAGGRIPNPIGDGIQIPSPSRGDDIRAPSEAHTDQESVAQDNSRSITAAVGGKRSAASELALGLARTIDGALAAARGDDASPGRTKADVAAAAELLEQGVPADFAMSMAEQVARAFVATAVSPRIHSTRYINPATLEAWTGAVGPSAGGGVGSSLRSRDGGSNNRAAREQLDQSLNKDPRVHTAINEYIEELNQRAADTGGSWWQRMKAEAKAAHRYATVYAYEHLKREPGRSGMIP